MFSPTGSVGEIRLVMRWVQITKLSLGAHIEIAAIGHK
jgi:hypothetical protein